MPGFVFADGLSPVLAAAGKRAIELLMQDNAPVVRLQENIRIFINEAKNRGFNTCLARESAIVPILVGNDIDAFILSERMLKNGVFVPAAVFPAVPYDQARLRFCLTSEHKTEQIIYALETLKQLFKDIKYKKVG
jgi:7-keto-8-aminopelargonate synthetase-like enzyme